MLYVLFTVLAIVYNLKKFRKERVAFLSSIVDAKNSSHREMILGHYFYVFIFEGFIALIVAHLISERSMAIGIPGFGLIYLCLIFLGFYLFQFFIRYVEKHTHLELYDSFKNHLIRELRVNFAVIMLPILIYSLINWAFLDNVYNEWGRLWFIGLLFNIIFVSVLTIVCSVVIMLRLIPNREITEREYLDIINKRLHQIGQPHMRIRWIESDIKNAFVVGLKLLRFSNQTMFIGRSLRTTLTLDEFDAVICHELGHVANRHIHKRVIDLIKNFLSVIVGGGLILFFMMSFSFLYWGEDAYLHSYGTSFLMMALVMAWVFFNYMLLFDTIRTHEYEADGYAVMKLGADFGSLKTALQKLSTSDELPDYLKSLTNKKKGRGRFSKWFFNAFSTHPDLEKRISFLEYKISSGLPFNYYVSTFQRVKRWLGHLFDWRIALPLTCSVLVTFFWAGLNFKSGSEAIVFIHNSSTDKIIQNEDLISKINSRPQLVGQTLMYFVVKKRDPKLIDHFVSHGADKGKTLMYISQFKDYQLFKKYYDRFQGDLSPDDYFLVLRKTAQVNFTEGYRLLVNAKRFETLNVDYKEDVSQLYKSNSRRPASVEKKK
jgi:Zn-dependent protease with chaperone function